MQCQRMQVGAPASARVAASSMMPLRAHGPRRSSTIAAAAPRLPVGLAGLAVILSHPHQAIAQARSEAGVSAHQTAPRPSHLLPTTLLFTAHLASLAAQAIYGQPIATLADGSAFGPGANFGLVASGVAGMLGFALKQQVSASMHYTSAAATPTRTGSKKRITLEPATSPPTSPTCAMHKRTSSVPLHPTQHPSLHV